MHDGDALHRGCEYNRGTGCGKTARLGLHGGCRVTGIPTVEAPKARGKEAMYTGLCHSSRCRGARPQGLCKFSDGRPESRRRHSH
jgi:hypothetical protein